MRLICTINKPDENPYGFSAYLKKQGIDNEVEEVVLPNENPFYRIWIVDEEKVDKAEKIYKEFQKNPDDERFQKYVEAVVETPETETKGPQKRRRGVLSPSPYGKVSIFIIAACILLFIFSGRSEVPPKIPGIVEAPLFSQVNKALLYDFPRYFELRDEFFKVFPIKDIKSNKIPPPEAETLLREIKATPFWTGIYERVVNHLKDKTYPLAYHGPIFEKISQGEYWRVFTPALLHFNLLHIFFNLLWFIMLGNQIEEKVGSLRYLILIILAAIVSNTIQYLMSGPFFLGLSGVVVALAGFIFARQQKAPWEGYLLNRMTIIFLFAFVFGMFALQSVFFFIQIFTKSDANLAIANTAHIVGGIVGYLLGRLNFYSLKRKI